MASTTVEDASGKNCIDNHGLNERQHKKLESPTPGN